MVFRPGQWVKFEAPEGFPQEAHRTADGRVVGIYHPAHEGRTAQGQRIDVPEGIAIVRPDGRDILVVGPDDRPLSFRADPAKVAAVAVTDHADLPPGRVFADGFQPTE